MKARGLISQNQKINRAGRRVDFLVEEELQERPSLLRTALLQERPGQQLAQGIAVVARQRRAIGLLGLGPVGEVGIAVAELSLNRGVVGMILGQGGDQLIEQFLILIRLGKHEGLHDRFAVIGLVAQFLKNFGALG